MSRDALTIDAKNHQTENARSSSLVITLEAAKEQLREQRDLQHRNASSSPRMINLTQLAN